MKGVVDWVPQDAFVELCCVSAINSLQMNSTSTIGEIAAVKADLDTAWILVTGFLVFFMQAGFSMLEAGGLRQKNVVNILLKNVLDVCVGSLAFFAFGFAFAFGDSSNNAFIGHKYFFLSNFPSATQTASSWFFQFAFSATASTIISGCVAERCNFLAYLVYTFIITGFTYPVVVHWVWSSSGWLSAFRVNSDGSFNHLIANGFIDFAGSTVVHITGGLSGLVAAIMLGPRLARQILFDSDDVTPLPGHNKTLSALGCMILWFGWYGFNPGSTLAVSDGLSNVAAVAAVNTTISATSAALTSFFVYRAVFKVWALMPTLNGLLAGLVAITASCSVVAPWASLIIGGVGAVVYTGSSYLLARMRIDDPLDAAPVHLFCGLWGTIAVGLFAEEGLIGSAYYGGDTSAVKGFGLLVGGGGSQLGMQIVAMLVIAVWVFINSLGIFGGLKLAGMLRVDEDSEIMGLDLAEHEGAAFVGDKADHTTGVEMS